MRAPRSNCADSLSYLDHLNAAFAAKRIPASGTFDLTQRCNLRCVHCYVQSPEQRAGKPARASAGGRALSTREVLCILDQAAKAGCLTMVLTGGEPLLRRDFATIYRHARECGMLVSVFTNGTLITPEVVAVLREYPPLSVEISLYGATPATYEAVTGVRGAYAACRRGIERLLRHGVRVALKTVVLTTNRHEFHAMEDLARTYGVKFRLDGGIVGRLDGDRSPIRYRIPAEELVALEFEDADRAAAWKRYYAGVKGSPASDRLYVCGAGLTSFHVNAVGRLMPCLMVPGVGYDLRRMRFATAWSRIVRRIDARKGGAGFVCSRCEKLAVCSYCPGFALLDQGRERARSDYLCALGQQRLQRLVTHSPR